MNDENRYERDSARADWRTDDEALAYYLIAPRFGAMPASVRDELDRIRTAALADADLARRIERMKSRLEELGAADELLAFERMTGHRLEEVPAGRPRHVRTRRQRPDRIATRTPRGRSRWLLGSAGVVAAVVLSVRLLVLQVPPYDDLARLQPEEPSLARELILRGESEPGDDAANVRYRYARSLLEGAETRAFWVIRRYDREKLVEALTLLQEASRTATPDTPVYAAIHFHVAKVYLALESPLLAEVALRAAASGVGPYADSARELAARLDPGSQ